jgi:hypothetical protein
MCPADLAWALAVRCGPHLQSAHRALVYVYIGAGETALAITALLRAFDGRSLRLPSELRGPMRRWVYGYAGTPMEAQVRELTDRLLCTPTSPAVQG